MSDEKKMPTVSELLGENTILRQKLAQIEHSWSSPLSRPERWATEPIPYPRRRNDLFRIQQDYMRSIEISSNGPTPAERSEKRCQLARDAMDMTHEVTHLRMTVQTARAEIVRLTEQLKPYLEEDERQRRWAAFEVLSDLRCLDCGIRYGERQEYSCQYPGKHTNDYPTYGAGHSYEKAEVDKLAKEAGHDS